MKHLHYHPMHLLDMQCIHDWKLQFLNMLLIKIKVNFSFYIFITIIPLLGPGWHNELGRWI